MKIIHIIPSIHSSGGAERLVVQLASEMSKTNDVTIITYRNIAEDSTYIKELSEKVKVFSLGKTKGFDLALSFKLYKLLKKLEPDVVNAHLPASFLYLILSILKLKRLKFTFTIHNLPTHEEKRTWVIKLRKWLKRNGKLSLITLSDISDIELKSYYGVKSDAIIRNGIVKPSITDNFEQVKNEIAQIKKSTTTQVFITIGRIDENKNQAMMCEVFDYLYREKKQDIILLIIGEAPFGGESYLEDLKKKAYDNIYFLGLKANIADYLACADVFCLSSFKEGLPLVVLEAFSYGLTILSTPVGGVPDVVDNIENGFLSDDFSHKKYIKLIERYLALSESEKQIISSKNIAKFNQEFTIQKTSEEYFNFYKKIVNSL